MAKIRAKQSFGGLPLAPINAPVPEQVDLRSFSTAELLKLYSQVLTELGARRVVRSGNNPLADYAEGLAAKALGVTLTSKSTTGYDATDAEGGRYEVKARRLSATNRSCQTSALRGLEKQHFDYLIGVIFDPQFVVVRACRVSWAVVNEAAVFKKHVRGHVLHLNQVFWTRTGVEDVTEALRAAQLEGA